jgi:hypothetical protein
MNSMLNKYRPKCIFRNVYSKPIMNTGPSFNVTKSNIMDWKIYTYAFKSIMHMVLPPIKYG